MATYDERARNYATTARQEYLDSLSYLTDDLAAKNQIDQQTLADKYNTLYEQIARQQDKVNTKFGTDAQAAYINKLMADRALDEQLSQLGVSTQGFGVNQRMLNENAYGQNLAALQQQQSEDLGDLANQLNDARGQYNVAAGQLASDYLAQLANAKQTQQSMADKYYTQAYNNYLADLQYQDQLKQQQWENNYRAQQLAASKASASASAKASSGLGSYANARYKQFTNSDNLTPEDAVKLLNQDLSAGLITADEYAYLAGLLGVYPTKTSTKVEEVPVDTQKERAYQHMVSAINGSYGNSVTNTDIAKGITANLDAGLLTDKQAEELLDLLESKNKKKTTSNTSTSSASTNVNKTNNYASTTTNYSDILKNLKNPLSRK